MKKRKLGATGTKTSIIGLGGGQFAGSEHSVEEILDIYRTALDNGVNFIDTAKDYGEERIGKALRELPRDKFFISTKTLAKNKEQTEKDIENSLDKLGLDKIDLYLIHNPMNIEDYKNRKGQRILEALKRAKDEGLIGNIGVSCDYIEPLELAIQDDIDVIMTHYNVGNTLSEDIIEKAYEKDIGIIAAKPFAGGILVNSGTEVEEGKVNNLTPEKALSFVLSNEKISTALVGARYPWQIKECAEVGKSFSSKDVDRERIKKEIFSFLGANFCRDCRYCWPCEELGYDFDISEILRFLDRYEKYGYKRFPRLGFSKLPYKDRIKDFSKCDVSCPFGINVRERLKQAKSKLGLEISERKWKEKLKGLEEQDKVSRAQLKGLEKETQLDTTELIERIHVNLIPEGKLDEEFGILIIEGIYSFGKQRTFELLGVSYDI